MQEDKILKYLREVRGISRWNDVAVTMNEEFSIFGRNGKQCRERYKLNNSDITITQIQK